MFSSLNIIYYKNPSNFKANSFSWHNNYSFDIVFLAFKENRSLCIKYQLVFLNQLWPNKYQKYCHTVPFDKAHFWEPACLSTKHAVVMFSDVWHTRLLEWFSEFHGNNWGNLACKSELYEIFCELGFPLPSTPSNSKLTQWWRQHKQGLKSKIQVHIICDIQELKGCVE